MAEREMNRDDEVIADQNEEEVAGIGEDEFDDENDDLDEEDEEEEADTEAE